MAAPARKPAPNSAPAAKKPPPGKGKGAPAETEAKDKTPTAPTNKLARFRLILFGGLGGILLATLLVAAWFAFFRTPPDTEPIPPPPALKPTPPTVVREGDLEDDLWRRLGVRPGQD
jgi:hypothetical protein